jgi:hypothetical protein
VQGSLEAGGAEALDAWFVLTDNRPLRKAPWTVRRTPHKAEGDRALCQSTTNQEREQLECRRV